MYSTIKKFEQTVSEECSQMRLDKFLALELEPKGLSRSFIGRKIKEGKVKINGIVSQRPSIRLQSGDLIEFEYQTGSSSPHPEAGELDIKWQDNDLLVLNKPAGINVHPAPSSSEATLVSRLLFHFPNIAEMDAERPGIVHRLDKETSGLLMVALSLKAKEQLASDLSERRIDKQYLVLVHGVPASKEGSIDLPIGRDQTNRTKMAVLTGKGREAHTLFQVLHVFPYGNYSLIWTKIITGRTHQIRVHMANKAHPVVGDKIYCAEYLSGLLSRQPILTKLLKRQMLHSWHLELEHPVTGEVLNFAQPVPKDMIRVMLQMEKRTQRIGITGMVGCGKSSLTRLLTENKIPVWNADQAVEKLYEPGADGWEMLTRTFGQRFLQEPEGPVDKAKLFQAMQESEQTRQTVLSLIHPLVEYDLEQFWQKHCQARFAIAEVPLLVEAGWHEKGFFDAVIGVHCPQNLRWTRLKEKRGWTEKQILQLESWQLSEKEKMQGSDLVVSNTGSWLELQKIAAQLKSVLTWLRRQKMKRFVQELKKNGIA